MAKKKPRTTRQQIVSRETVERRILLIRGHKVILDSVLAELYGVQTKYLKRQVNRNKDRFPADFMFQLSKSEFDALRFQFGTSSQWGGTRYPPYVFTQEGVAMLSGVLRSQRAVLVNVALMRAFVKLRELLATHKDLARKLEALEKKYDASFRVVFEAIRELMAPDTPPRRQQIGFDAKKR